jgi:protein-L-isoaspartate(D-aspartate) O-methyltransferase
MEESYHHKGLRRQLVDTLKVKGINDPAVLRAIGTVPRHAFMDSGFLHFSYKDQAFPIGSGQTISQPYTVAFQTQLLEVKPFEKVMEIGTGSGYQAAVLSEMKAIVYTVERQRELYLKAQRLLSELGYSMHFFYGDGYDGLPSYAPFDKILVTAAAPEVPENLLRQLRPGGILVIPVGDEVQTMLRIRRVSQDEFETSRHGSFVFVPFVKGKV